MGMQTASWRQQRLIEARLDGKHKASWSWQKQPRQLGVAGLDACCQGVWKSARLGKAQVIVDVKRTPTCSQSRPQPQRQTDCGQTLDSTWPAADSRGVPLSRDRSALAAAGTL